MPSPPPTGDPLPRWLAIGDDPALVLPAFALAVATESQPHRLTFLGSDSACAAARQRAEALGVGDRLTVGPVPEGVQDVAADHDLFVQLSGSARVEQATAALAAGLPALLVRTPAMERAATMAVDLSVAELVTPGDAAAAAAGYARLLVRLPDADWATLRALLESRHAASRPAPTKALVVAVDDLAFDALVPVLDALSACRVITDVRRLVRDSPGQVLPLSLHRFVVAAPSRSNVGSRRSARDFVSAVPSLAMGQVARVWATRKPREIAAYVQSLVQSTAPDIIVVDEYVSAAWTAIKPDLPFTASITQRPRLWRHLAQLVAPATTR